jgi:hypothetical protein
MEKKTDQLLAGHEFTAIPREEPSIGLKKPLSSKTESAGSILQFGRKPHD